MRCFVIGNDDDGGGKEKVRSLGGRSFQNDGYGSVGEHETRSDRE